MVVAVNLFIDIPEEMERILADIRSFQGALQQAQEFALTGP
jgi:hypothetical protein